MFDMPTYSNEEKKEYIKFRKSLLEDGFIMMQYSIYSRFCRNDSEYSKYVRRIKSVAPRNGSEIRIIALTEKQYQKMHLISTKRKTDEELLGINPLVIIE